MEHWLSRAACSALTLVLLAGPAAAGVELSPKEADTIVVTASRYAQAANTVPAHVIVVSSAQIMAAPTRSLDDVLRELPGAQIGLFGSSNIINPALQTVSLLGVGMPVLGGVRSLVMMDGLPLSDGFGGWVPWSMIPKQMVERVETMLGASSNLYGSSAIGGAINIITRSPKAAPAADLDVYYGSRNTKQLNAYGSGAFLDKFGVGVDYSYYKTDGYQWLEPNARGPVDQKSNARNWSTHLKLASLKSDASGPAWFVHGIVFRDNRFHGLEHWFDSRAIDTVSAGAHRSFDNGGVLSARAFVGSYLLDSTNSSVNAARTSEAISIHNYMPSVDSGGSLQWSQGFDRLASSVTVGVDVRHTAARNNEDDYSPAGVYSTSISSGGQQTTLGFFGQWTFSPVADLTLAPSARVDYWSNHDAFQIDKSGRAPIAPKEYAFFSPRMAARYQVAEPLAVRAAVYRAFFAPNLQALYRGANAQNELDLPNSELSPEILRYGAEFGWDWTLGPAALRTTLFLNQIQDAIVTTTISQSPLITKPENVGGIRSRGVVVEAPWRIDRRWSLSSAYTFTDSVITSNSQIPGLVGKMVAGIPRHQASATLGFDDPRIATVRLAARYLTRRWGNDLNTIQLDEHFILDLSASRYLTPSLEVYFDGENLTDRRYAIAQMGLPVLGEPLYVGAGVRLHYR